MHNKSQSIDKSMVVVPFNLNSLLNSLQETLGCLRTNLHSIQQTQGIFNNKYISRNPEVSDLEKILDSENTCDMDRLNKIDVAARILNLMATDICNNLRDSLGH